MRCFSVFAINNTHQTLFEDIKNILVRIFQTTACLEHLHKTALIALSAKSSWLARICF